MRSEHSQSDAPAVTAVLDRAIAVLAVHTDDNGMCAGCLGAWARLAPSPCEQRRWATSVVKRHGSVVRSATARTN
jgi:hypothetical protein